MNPNNHTTIGGIYEVCIGVTDAISAIQYWQQFGYHIGEIGELTAATAYQLYQVNSSLQSIRLYHQNVDHGLILTLWRREVVDFILLDFQKILR